MNKDVYNHLGVAVGTVFAKVVDKYGVKKIGDATDVKNRQITRGAISVMGMGVGIYDAFKETKIPNPVSYGLTAIGSYNLSETLLGTENVIGITGKMFQEELAVTTPDITRLRAKIGAATNEVQKLRQENAQLKARAGTMFPEETIKFSPGSTVARGYVGQEAGSEAIMTALGTMM